MLSALFLFLSFKELGFFAWFALLPFLFTVYKSNLKQTVIFSFICGIGFFMGLIYWMMVLPVKFVWLLLVPILAVIFLIYGIAIYFILEKIDKPCIRIFLIPAVWILVEFLRSQSYLAFTIGILGYSQYNFLPLMQITRFTGIYGVSFIIVLFNACIFETIISSLKNRKAVFKYLIACTGILLIFNIYGIISVNNNLNRLIKNSGYEEIKVAMVQTNIQYDEKFSCKGSEILPAGYSKNNYFREGTELVVFPESMLWGSVNANEGFKNWAEKITEEEKIYILIGQYVHNEDQSEYYNSALLYDSDLKIAGRYNEIHPVPFIQHIPYPEVLGYLNFIDFTVAKIVPGRDYTPINYPGKGRVGVNICYESTIPSIARNLRNNGAEAIFVLADNSSLDNSIAPWHHLIFSKIRAIENGCYVAHCANTGISAIISPSGEIMERSDLMEEKIIYGSIFLMPEITFYSRYGNIIMLLYCGSAFLTAFLYLLTRKIKNRI